MKNSSNVLFTLVGGLNKLMLSLSLYVKVRGNMSKRPGSKGVKHILFLKCGKVCMYDMKKYDRDKLVLHHDPPFRKTKHTVYEESYLILNETHIELHKLELDDRDEYNRRMEIIIENKKILELRRNNENN